MNDLLTQLLNLYLAGDLTKEQAITLSQLLDREEHADDLALLIHKQLADKDFTAAPILTHTEARLLKALTDRLGNKKKRMDGYKQSVLWKIWKPVAAVFIFLFVSGGYYWYATSSKHKHTPTHALAKKADRPPGTHGAVLTLSDGRIVVLDSLKEGWSMLQDKVRIFLQNGQLIYDASKAGKEEEVRYNTITTPKGQHFSLLLADNTKIWLNAGSSIQYPIAFAGNERKVSMNGEAFFTVSKNKQKPFRVNVKNKIEIEVLGTSFIVNAFEEGQGIQTTLLEGSVKIKKSGKQLILQPGQQALITDSITLATANMAKATAWKTNLFYFEGVGLRELMHQLERWYNIEVIYEGNVPDVSFIGKMSRNIALSEVLIGLEGAGVHFRLEAGGKLFVTP